MLSHFSVMVSAMGSLASTDAVSDGGMSIFVAPMFHMAAIAHWTMSLVKDCSLLFVPVFEPNAIVKLIDKHQATDALLVNRPGVSGDFLV
ncbi:hypothetical protein [Renibacterium salmoninarum]|nr:hypothetical protein [Renibacterium salmoninarum]